MSLEEYSRKRNFAKTPEPGPEKVNAAGSARYFIQRHNASHLHYDFRLEIDGVLKSWAIPKGPTLAPLVRRLAMQVEDHPITYGNFEGTIPSGNYGAGSVMLWDRGTFTVIGTSTASEQLKRGDLKFTLSGQKLRGEFALVRMKGAKESNSWLLIKKKDGSEDPQWNTDDHAISIVSNRTQDEIANGDQPSTAMPESITPMQAFLASEIPVGDRWLFELKWDGIRAVCFVEHGKLRLQGRSGKSFTGQYPELQEIATAINAETAILDGEIVLFDEQGRSSFAALQPRLMATGKQEIQSRAEAAPATFYAFDLLFLNGRDLRSSPLLERKRLLTSLLQPSERIRLSDHYIGQGPKLKEFAQKHGLEGIMAKRADSIYESKRSKHWLKIKTVSQQEFVIAGYTLGQTGELAALLLGVYKDRKLTYVSKVGTGFSGDLLAELRQRLSELEIARSAFLKPPKLPDRIVWVEPKLVAEVRFSMWMADGSLRAPVFLGLRPDVTPQDCLREESVSPPSERFEASAENSLSLTVNGRTLKLTNLNKLWFPKDGYSKRRILEYYDAVAPLLLPHLRDRPLALKRYPDGIDSPHFFQKQAGDKFPDWIQRAAIPDGEALLCNDHATLLYLTNLGCIDQNPWMSRTGQLSTPDFLLIDLDPVECPFSRVIEAANLIRSKLDRLELEGYAKTTGGDGLHIYIPLKPKYTYGQTKSFAEVLARWVAAERPDLFTLPRAVAQRETQKVYFDYVQIGEGRTVAAPYVIRAYAQAPVATPLAWSELKATLLPTDFHIGNARQRFEKKGDLFAGVLTNGQSLEPALTRIQDQLRAKPKKRVSP